MTWQVEQIKDDCSAYDIGDLARLLKQLTSRTLDTGESTLQESLSDGMSVVVRHRGGRIIGTASLHWNRLHTGLKGSIDDVVVDQEYRRQGIARAMIIHLLDQAKQKKIFRLSLTNNPDRHPGANLLYLSLGFELYETDVYRIVLSEVV